MTTITAELEGRTLSSKTLAVLRRAMEALQELMGTDKPDNEEQPPAEMAQGFYFVDLGLTPGKRFAGFALGKFIDMHGRAVEFAQDSITDFKTNTLKAIAAAKAKNMPGLPIDAKNHDKGEAAGWIVDAELGEVTDSTGKVVSAIFLAAEWTSLGVRLLSEKILTNFSPTVDLTNKTIRGGSLTNWPASVDANGVPLFNAVELSNRADLAAESQEAFLSGDGITMAELTQVELEKLVSDKLEAALTELANGTAVNDGSTANKFAELVEQRVNARWQEKIELMQRESAAAELARDVTGRGLPVPHDMLTAELMKLPPSSLQFWGDLMKTVVTNGVTGFAELGSGERGRKEKLDPAIKHILDSHVAQGGTVADFFAHAGIGDATDYDLSAYEGGK